MHRVCNVPTQTELRNAAPLQPRRTLPDTLEALTSYVQTSTSQHRAIEIDAFRDDRLAEYRRQFDAQLKHDLAYNLQRLHRWSDTITPVSSKRDGEGLSALRELATLHDELASSDSWADTNEEIRCYQLFSQFYCTALFLADRLLRHEHDERLRLRPDHRVRYHAVGESTPATTRSQALLNAVDQALPGVLKITPLTGMIPMVWYAASRATVPWLPYRFMTLFRKARRFVDSGALGSIGPGGGVCPNRGAFRDFLSDPEYFDTATGKTRHNLILVFSHRHSTIDTPVMAHALAGKGVVVWLNAMYFPKSAAHDPDAVLVEPGHARFMRATLERCREVLTEQRMPLMLVADGSSPYLLYGQQMRVKRGIRLLVDYLKRTAGDGPRRTFVVPLTFDDVATYIMGRDDQIRLAVHTPIVLDDIAAAPRGRNPQMINRGDPLLNHLEALFLANTGQVRHGWTTPCVERTVRQLRHELNSRGDVRSRVRRRFHATMFDLCRQPALEEPGPAR